MFKQPSPQLTMREFLSSCISMRNSRLLVLLATLFCLSQGALAQEDNREAYAVLDANGLLKFYYDTNKSDASASGTVYDVPWDSGDYGDPGWITWDNDIMDYIENTVITSVAFDISFREYNLESANAMFASCTALTSIDFTYFNTSNVRNMSYMFYNCSALTNTGLNLSNFSTENVFEMEAMFSGCSSLQTLNLSNFNTSNVLYMSDMFFGCSGLETLNISNFNTENVNDMEEMFSGCSSLQTLNLSNFNTSNVHYMSYMFSGCSGLQTLDLSNFNTSNVESMEEMFSGCSGLQTLNLSNFNTRYVWNMNEMFHGCSILTTIYCNNDWYKEVVESNDMFSGCTQLVGAVDFDTNNANDVTYANPTTGYFTETAIRPYAVYNNGTLTFYYGEYNDDPDVEAYLNFQWELYPAWQEVSENITTVTFDASFINYPISSTAFMFNDLYNLTTINGLEYLNTSNVTDMSYMFSGCSLLKTLDLTSFNTENVTYMLYMFAYCNLLSNIYCNDNWNTHEINSEKMFFVCEKLPGYEYDADNDITYAKPTSEGGYFTKLEAYATVVDGNLSFFYDGNKPASGSLEFTNTGEGTWRSASFTSVTFDPSMRDYKFTSTAGMFSGLTGLTVINDLTYLNTSANTDMSNMFNGCSSLATIYCNNDWSSLTIPSDNMFLGCTQLDGYNAGNVSIDFARPTEGGYFTKHAMAYAVLKDDGTLTFYYDLLKGTRQGIVYDLPWDGDHPGWNSIDEDGDYESIQQNITSVEFNETFYNFHGLTTTSNMFDCLYNLRTISGIEYLNTSNVTDMSKMFSNCYGLSSLDLSSFDTGNVTNMSKMFSNCSGLTSLDLSGWTNTKVTNMKRMFGDCTSLSNLDVTDFNTWKVTNMSEMFFDCNALTILDLSSFNTENVTDMKNMFAFCTRLSSLDLSSFNTRNVTNMSYMFNYCSSITSLDLTNFDVTNVSYANEMFAYCSELATIFCNDDWSKITDSGWMFIQCYSLAGASSYGSNYDATFANPTTGYFTYGLRDYAENSSLLDRIEDMPRVGLVGRTLYKTGDWNTLCLPFSVGDSNPNDGLTFSGTPLEGATVMTLDNSADSETGFDPSSGILTLNFVEENYIEAGDPYIIKWENTGENIVNPIFTNVYYGSTAGSFGASDVSFIGIYDPLPLTSANSNILYLGAGNALYYPSANMTINSFRAYFELNLTSGQQVKAINLNFGDEEAASIKTISESSDHSKDSDAYFTLDGRRLNDKPTQKGMYINNGRKVLIK